MSKILARLFILLLLISSSISAFTIYEDKNSHITEKEIFKYEDKFYTPKEGAYSYTDSSFWLKFDFSKDITPEKYILFNFAVLTYVDMFYKSDGIIQEVNYGAGVQRELPFNEIILTIPLEKIESKIIYVRIKHKGVLSLENRIFDSKEDIYNLLVLRDDITTFMVAITILIMLFISVIAYNLKEITYRLFLMLLFFTLIMELAINNSLTWIIGAKNIDFIFQVGVDLTAVALYLFIMNITNMKEAFPKIYKIFKLLTTITLYIFITEFLQNKDIHTIKTVIIVPTFLSIVFASLVYMYYKNVKYSILISIGWLFFLASAVVLYLSVNGMIIGVYNPIIWKVLIILEMITFSLLLLYRIKELADENVKHELVLEEQSKLAVIGETLTNIEHQWRSPLSKISSNIIALETELEVKGKVENKSLKKALVSMTDTLDYMTNLVDYFKVFYMKDQDKKPFLIGNSYLRVSRLLEYDFLKYSIQIEYIDNDKIQILGHLNEFTQVLLNILSNSRDIFIQREIKKPKIEINVSKKDNNVIITIEDNAGGIDEENLENIFNQFFSDKDKQSTGVGLYLCKHIVEKKMNGTIRVKNKNQGARFIIKL
ncbi:MAG: GHKL domain-containing protein [Sulfurimonas sp.]|nr:GHKL domain-containing protein [Sulfurimonas sp.]